MPGVLRFFGVAAFLGGGIMAFVTALGTRINDGLGGSLNLVYAAAWALGGLFWMALCLTVASISDRLDEVQVMVGKPSR